MINATVIRIACLFLLSKAKLERQLLLNLRQNLDYSKKSLNLNFWRQQSGEGITQFQSFKKVQHIFFLNKMFIIALDNKRLVCIDRSSATGADFKRGFRFLFFSFRFSSLLYHNFIKRKISQPSIIFKALVCILSNVKNPNFSKIIAVLFIIVTRDRSSENDAQALI